MRKLRPLRTARGLITFEPFKDRSGGELTLTESSETVEPHMWVAIHEAPSTDNPGGREACAHLTLAEMQALRDAIEYALVNHRLAP